MSKLAKSTVGLMIVTLFGKMLGFIRELVLANVYGATMYSDAYIVAMNIPNVILVSIGAALTTTFIPMYYEIKTNSGEDTSLKYTNNMLNIIVIICLVLSFIGLVFTDQIVKLFAVGFREEVFIIAVKFTRILIIGMIFTGLSYIMTVYLQVKEDFIAPGFVSLPYNIIIITSILLSIKYGPYAMVWGTLIGMISQFIFQVPFAKKKGYNYQLYFNIKDNYIKKTVWLLGPVFIGVAVNQVNSMIDKTLASTLVEGSISSLNYANKLNNFITAMFISSISVVIYPMLSKLSSEDNKEDFNKSIVGSINSVILLIIPISIGAIVFAQPIVRLLFERGEFDTRATNMTSMALIMYSIGMIAFGLRDILGKVFYSLKDTKTPMINGIISMAMNIILNIILVKYFSHSGLALATSISSIICIVLLFRSLDKKVGYFGQNKIILVLVKTLVASIIMGIVSKILYSFIIGIWGLTITSELVALTISVIIGIIVYTILLIMFKIDEIDSIINLIKIRMKVSVSS